MSRPPASDELAVLFAEVGRAAADNGQLDQALTRLATTVDAARLRGAICRLPTPTTGRCPGCHRLWPARRLLWHLRSGNGGHRRGGIGCAMAILTLPVRGPIALVRRLSRVTVPRAGGDAGPGSTATPAVPSPAGTPSRCTVRAGGHP